MCIYIVIYKIHLSKRNLLYICELKRGKQTGLQESLSSNIFRISWSAGSLLVDHTLYFRLLVSFIFYLFFLFKHLFKELSYGPWLYCVFKVMIASDDKNENISLKRNIDTNKLPLDSINPTSIIWSVRPMLFLNSLWDLERKSNCPAGE